MGFKIKKDFCVWLVSPSDGTVKKVRFTSFRALAVLAVLTVLGLGVVFIAGDYTRVQMLRAKNFFNLQTVKSERNSLASQNTNLITQVKGLESETSRAKQYEREIRDRISEMSSVLKSAKSFGLIGKDRLPENSLKSNEDDGIGGASLDCAKPSTACSSSSLSKADDSGRAMFSPSRFNRSEQDLTAVLDSYIDVLNKVPFMLPIVGYVTSGYGVRRSPFTGRRELHSGIDFSLPHGSQIVATADGKVKSAKRNGGYGLMIDIEHENGVVTRYAHLSKFLVKKGQKVCQGQLIGLVGSTGRSTGPHLHYEILLKGKSLNPKKLLSLGQTLDGSF